MIFFYTCNKAFSKVFFLFLFLPFCVNAQQTNGLPGAVANPFVWLQSAVSQEQYQFKNATKAPVNVSDFSKKGNSFNFNPSIRFSSIKDSISVNFGTSIQNNYTFFIAYKVKDSVKEQFLWTLENDKNTIALATNKQLVDLNSYYYKSYNEKIKPNKANIHFYQQNKTEKQVQTSTFSIGYSSKNKTLPPSIFDGNIAEILIYKRVLSSFETQKIASYLSIKYGISLSSFENKNYINSQGDIIWEAKTHGIFNESITALGREDASGLLQTKSSNMAEEGFLTMELVSKSNKIPNNYFVFWSDNQKSLYLKKQQEGKPNGISRIWQLDFTNPSDISLNWYLDPKFIKGTPEDNEFYWLAIDYSGKATFDSQTTEYVQLRKASSKEIIPLKELDWDKQKTGKAHFSIQLAPEMFSVVNIADANCNLQNSGALKYRIVGGKSPYTISLKKENTNELVKQWIQSNKNETSVAVPSGSYEYFVKDANGLLYKQNIFVADKQGTQPNLLPKYEITNNTPILIDASNGLAPGDYDYQWFYEGEFLDATSQLFIDQPGAYELRLTNDNYCKTVTKFQVTADAESATNVSTVLAYPNPIIHKNFSIAMNYPSKTNVLIHIFSPTGSLLKEKSINQIENYVYEEVLNVPSGMYLAKITSDFGTKTIKLMVK